VAVLALEAARRPREASVLLSYSSPEVAAQWHPTKVGELTPSKVMSKSHTKRWWLCDAGNDHEWEANPDQRVRRLGNSGCPCCKGKEMVVTNSLATIKPTVAALWDYERNECDPVDVIAGSGKKYWFQLPKIGAMLRSPSSFLREDGRGGSRTDSVLLSDALPEVVAQWHPIMNGEVTPADVASQSNTKCWWKCDISPDHEWVASPGKRVNGGSRSTCPCCSGHKVSVTNSLASLAPKVAAQWHSTKNGDVTPAGIASRSSMKRWWRCDASSEHVWEATPNNRVGNGTDCPYCSGRKGPGK
jgi:hypothetical protein